MITDKDRNDPLGQNPDQIVGQEVSLLLSSEMLPAVSPASKYASDVFKLFRPPTVNHQVSKPHIEEASCRQLWVFLAPSPKLVGITRSCLKFSSGGLSSNVARILFSRVKTHLADKMRDKLGQAQKLSSSGINYFGVCI